MERIIHRNGRSRVILQHRNFILSARHALGQLMACKAVLLLVLIVTPVSTFACNNYSALIAKASRQGEVAVIVGLKLMGPGFRPEGELKNEVAVKRQRNAIAAAKKALIESLSGLVYSVYGDWDSLPSLAIKASPAALKVMISSPYVSTLQEDSLSRTQRIPVQSE